MDLETQKKLKEYLQYTIALLEAMEFGLKHGKDEILPYASYRDYMRKSNELVHLVNKLITTGTIVDMYDLDKVKSAFDTLAPQQKNFFEMVYTNLMILRKFLESKLEIKRFEAQSLTDFIQLRLRKVIFGLPEKELEIQNGIEQLLVGRGLSKGVDYDREVGRVKVSAKEFIPDFIISEFNLAIEVKLIKDKARVKTAIEEINSDIHAYSKEYPNILFVIYDMGYIRDEDEFKNDLDNNSNVRLIVVKH